MSDAYDRARRATEKYLNKHAKLTGLDEYARIVDAPFLQAEIKNVQYTPLYYSRYEPNRLERVIIKVLALWYVLRG